MNRVRFRYPGPVPELERRRILGESVARFHAAALARFGATDAPDAGWEIHLGGDLLFDVDGLRLLAASLDSVPPGTARVEFRVTPDADALRDYYGLHEDRRPDGSVRLPAEARRTGVDAGETGIANVTLPSSATPIPFPRALAEPVRASAPHALLLAFGCDFDLLFANQIAYPAELRRRVPSSPRAWWAALFGRHPRDRALRAATAWREIAPGAEVHPTAVVEGSVISAGARVGAHCTVRFSHVAEDARLHDGAKVEFSTVGPRSWLMHDLVLYRCHVEDEVFLIHGPYQFSCFHSGSAAFATILMDYLPHGGGFRVMTPRGIREYAGRFLGSVYREGARTLGGTLLAPGRILPANTWLAADPSQIHRKIDSEWPLGSPIPPGGPAPGTGPGPSP